MAEGAGGERQTAAERAEARHGDVKSVTKIAAPESYQVLWEEHLTEKPAPTVKTQMWTGTFTSGTHHAEDHG